MLRFEALADGSPTVDSSPSDPIVLNPGEQLELTLLITNVTSIPIEIAAVELEGRVLGLTFLSSRTGIDETVLPGEERLLRFPVDLYGVDGQAHGLLRGTIEVSNRDGVIHASQPVILDGRGHVLAATSLLALAFFAVGGLALAVVLFWQYIGIVPDERRTRGLQLVPAGAALGLGLSAAFSVVRIWPLPVSLWIFVSAAMSLGFYVAGFLAPTFGRLQRLETVDLTDGSDGTGESFSISAMTPDRSGT
ncbi:MAG: hypothetical protein ACR2QO_15140 [Acidimicrobiales bacterium]